MEETDVYGRAKRTPLPDPETCEDNDKSQAVAPVLGILGLIQKN